MTKASRRPVIGVTGPDRGGTTAWWFSALAVYRAGGCPRRIRPRKPVPAEELQGLILGGGVDLDPALYGGDPGDIPQALQKKEGSRRFSTRLFLFSIYLLRRLFSLKHPAGRDKARDSLEVSLLKTVLSQQKPVLGICRGSQLLNAALGGSLHQETRGFYTETPYIRSVLPRKKIHITPGSFLASLLPGAEYRVNSLHHQAVHLTAPGLEVSAREENGLIQAVEDPSRPFVLGVQWHPEYLPHLAPQQFLFRKLVEAAIPS